MYLGLRRIARLLSGHGHPPAASERVTSVFSPCFCSKMTNGDNKFGIYWLREREHCSLQLNGLQYNPYGRLCPVKACRLRLLLRMSDNTTLQTNKSVLFLSPDPLKEEHKCSSEQECFVLEYKKRSWCLDSAGNDSVMFWCFFHTASCPTSFRRWAFCLPDFVNLLWIGYFSFIYTLPPCISRLRN